MDGGAPSERQSNSRLGATLLLPLAKGQSFKISYSAGVSGNVGSKFNQYDCCGMAVCVV